MEVADGEKGRTRDGLSQPGTFGPLVFHCQTKKLAPDVRDEPNPSSRHLPKTEMIGDHEAKMVRVRRRRGASGFHGPGIARLVECDGCITRGFLPVDAVASAGAFV